MKEQLICIVTPANRCYFRAIPLAKEFLDKDQNIIHTAGNIPDGEITELKITTKTIKHYADGKLDGNLQTIDLSTGKITFTEQYKNGQLVNLSTVAQTLSEDSPLQLHTPASRYRGTVVKINKDTQSFYADGKEIAEQTVSPQGIIMEQLGTVPDGPVKEFDDNGMLRMECTYQNNLLDGPMTVYNEQGLIVSNENYVRGKLHGEATYYNYGLDGRSSITAHYNNTLLEGEWISYFPNGKTFIKAQYLNGKLQGERRLFYHNTQLNIKETYANGKLQGQRLIYFPEGNLWYQENYKNGRLDGDRLCFFHNGKKYLEEFYTDGLLEGPRNIYAENGQLLTHEEYHWGTLIQNTERTAR